MKKFLALVIILCAGLIAFGQSTSPRFGTLKNQDNTGRVLTYKYLAITDATGADSVIVKPSAFQTIYKVTLKDSIAFKSPVSTLAYLGDEIVIIGTATTGTPFMKFPGTAFVSAGTATLSTGLRAVITFVFDGTKWVEKSRVVQ